MSLAINTNVTSMIAQQNLSRTSSNLATSLQRLSSGLKINSGADGPAALVISQEQQSQIAGLQAAIDNTSKGVSMIQTAEGALSEINTLLTKVRGLAVDSANAAVNDPTSLTANQSEITNALETITNIAKTTQFGSTKLLDGTLGAVTTQTNLAAGNTSIFESSKTTGLDAMNLPVGTYKLEITQPKVDDKASTVTHVLTAETGVDHANFFNDGATVPTGVDASAVTNDSVFQEAGQISVGKYAVSYSLGDTVGDTIAALNNVSGNQYTVSLSDTDHKFTVTAKAGNGAAGDGAVLRIAGSTYQGEVTPTTGGVTAVHDAAGKIVDSNGNTVANLVAKTGSDGTVLVNSNVAGQDTIEFDLANDNDTSPSGAYAVAGTKYSVYSVATAGNGAVFQIGGNAGQTASISIGDMQASALGTGALEQDGITPNSFASLADINVQTGSAQDALAVIDKAVSEVSTLRGNLGAFQANTLQATATNLQTTLSNTAAAESTIQDTDFAAETANYTKDQVLLQAGTTVLANSNQIPQLVLQLLK